MPAALEAAPIVGLAVALVALGLSRATHYRKLRSSTTKPARKSPPRKLPPEERKAVLDVLHEPRFADSAPAQVYATLRRESLPLLRAHDVPHPRRES